MTVKSLIPHSRPWITDEDREMVLSQLKTKMISRGEVVSRFESEVCCLVGANQGIATASGTASLVLALKALNIGVGDEVVLPTYVCRSVLDAIEFVGAKGVLCDVNENGVITYENARKVVSSRTKAVVAVHIFGHHCDISRLRALDIPVIEDACHAFGENIDGAMAGVIGEVGIFSFHATKCLTTGEGGMVVTKNSSIDLSGLKYDQGEGGRVCVAPMSDLQAALGLSQLRRFPQFVERRKGLKKRYSEAAESLGLTVGTDRRTDIPFRFTLRSDKNFRILEDRFLERGVSIRRGVDMLLHRLIGLDDKNFPNAVKLFESTVSVPFYPGLTDKEVSRVVNSLEVLCQCR